MERNTEQKKVILESLRSVSIHPTAEIVHKIVTEKLPNVSLATIYRNLNLLTQKGEVLRFEINKEYRYDGHIGKHQHFICNHCKNILDIFDPKISIYALNRIKDQKLKTESVNIIFHGICKECK